MTKHTTTGPPSTSTRSSCFLGCFGLQTLPTDEVNSGSRRRKWSLFKKSPTKTVPVDLTTVGNDATRTSDTSWEIHVMEENATSTKKHVTLGEQKTGRKKWTTVVKRQKEPKPAAKSVVGPGRVSAEQKTVAITRPSVSAPLRPFVVSKSVLPPNQQKSTQHIYVAGGRANCGVLHKTSQSRGDSIIGMSIILVILVILVLWGKLCAILCTSAWFFIAPRLVAIKKRSAADKLLSESRENLDLESEEYKKKVVLEGLLQRDHRKVVG